MVKNDLFMFLVESVWLSPYQFVSVHTILMPICSSLASPYYFVPISANSCRLLKPRTGKSIWSSRAPKSNHLIRLHLHYKPWPQTQMLIKNPLYPPPPFLHHHLLSPPSPPSLKLNPILFLFFFEGGPKFLKNHPFILGNVCIFFF